MQLKKEKIKTTNKQTVKTEKYSDKTMRIKLVVSKLPVINNPGLGIYNEADMHLIEGRGGREILITMHLKAKKRHLKAHVYGYN